MSKRRKKSAYLNYEKGRVVSTEPNSVKEKIKNHIPKEKKSIHITSAIPFFLYLFCTFLFICFFLHEITPLSHAMKSKESKYEINIDLNSFLNDVNLKERKIKEKNKELLLSDIELSNTYNKDLSTMYSEIKSSIILYENRKEGIRNTRKTFETLQEKIKITPAGFGISDETLEKLYEKRYSNLQQLLENLLATKSSDVMIEKFNEKVNEENALYKKCEELNTEKLEKKDVNYQIENEQIKIIK